MAVGDPVPYVLELESLTQPYCETEAQNNSFSRLKINGISNEPRAQLKPVVSACPQLGGRPGWECRCCLQLRFSLLNFACLLGPWPQALAPETLGPKP